MQHPSKRKQSISRQLGIRVGLVVWVGFLLLAVACGAPASPSPVPAAASSHIDPDVLEAVRKLLEAEDAGLPPPAATPTPTRTKPPPTATSRITTNISAPLYWPTFADFQVAIAPPFRSAFNSDFLDYGIVYAASECVAGRELSSEGFRAFVAEVGDGEDPGIRAKTVIGQMLTLSASGARLDCLNPYLHPTTGTEVYLAAELVSAAEPGIAGSPMRLYYRDALKKMAFRWLGEGAQQGQSILRSLLLGSLGEGALKDVEIPAHVPIPKNTRGLNVQAWAAERELWEIRQTIKPK